MGAAPNSNPAKVSDGLPSPPFIHVPGVVNLRDAGGYAIQGQPGKAVRRGIVFRSADLSRLEDEGITVLRELGITHVFDLRSLPELAKANGQQPKTWEGATRVFVPVFLDRDYSPEVLALRFRNYTEGREVSMLPNSHSGSSAVIVTSATSPPFIFPLLSLLLSVTHSSHDRWTWCPPPSRSPLLQCSCWQLRHPRDPG